VETIRVKNPTRGSCTVVAATVQLPLVGSTNTTKTKFAC
jgi:hypothetical protein